MDAPGHERGHFAHHRENGRRSRIPDLYRDSSPEPHGPICGGHGGTAARRERGVVQSLQGIEQWVARTCRAATFAGRTDEKRRNPAHRESYAKCPRQETSQRKTRDPGGAASSRGRTGTLTNPSPPTY